MRILANGSVVLENGYVRLVIDQTGVAESLVYKETGEELLASGEQLPLFSVSQERPFNNEVKLAHMNKYTTYPATDLCCEEDRLTVSFAEIPCKAVIRVAEREEYITFTLERSTSGDYFA